MTDDDDIEALFARTAEERGRVDVVVNNAGITPDGALGRPERVDPDTFDLTVD